MSIKGRHEGVREAASTEPKIVYLALKGANIMRKMQLFVVLVLALTFVAPMASAFAGGPYPVVTEFAVKQSMDLGDPYSFTLLIAMEKAVNAQHATMILADPGQLVNVEHPDGSEGLIVGELIVYDPEAAFDTVRADAEARGGGSMPMIYVGAQTLPTPTVWTNASDYWIIDPRSNTIGAPIDVPNSTWEWPSVPLGVSPVDCPTTVSMCLYQAWDGLNGQRAWHFAMQSGTSFTPPFPMEGSLFQVSNVAAVDMPTLVARYAQMVEEVVVRDDPDPLDDDLNMVVFPIWVGSNPATGWTPISSFDFETSVIETGVGATINGNGVRVREQPNTGATILVTFNTGEAVVVLARDEQTPISWLHVRYTDADGNLAEGWVRSDLVTLANAVLIEDLTVFTAVAGS